MKKTWILLLAAFSVLIIAIILVFSLRCAARARGEISLRGSKEAIRESILAITPAGTSMDDVLKVIADNESWELGAIWQDSGYGKADNVVGVKSIRAHIGTYMFIFQHDVTVLWGFDADEKLIDVAVHIDIDAL